MSRSSHNLILTCNNKIMKSHLKICNHKLCKVGDLATSTGSLAGWCSLTSKTRLNLADAESNTESNSDDNAIARIDADGYSELCCGWCWCLKGLSREDDSSKDDAWCSKLLMLTILDRIVWRGFPSLELWPWVEGGVPSDIPTQQPTVRF